MLATGWVLDLNGIFVALALSKPTREDRVARAVGVAKHNLRFGSLVTKVI